MKKIHLQHSKYTNLHPVCGRFGKDAEATSQIEQVNCQSCLNTIAGKKKGGRPQKADGRNKVQIVLSDRALEEFKKIPAGDRSKVLSNYLERLSDRS